MSERINSVLFDIKQSIDDFGNEFNLLIMEVNKLKERVKSLEEKKQ